MDSSVSELSLEAALSKLESLKRLSEELISEIMSCSVFPSRPPPTVKTERILLLLNSYKEVRTWMLYNKPDIGQHMCEANDEALYDEDRELRLHIDGEKVLSILQGIVHGCETAIPPLRSIVKPEIPRDTLNKLTSLKEELKSLDLDSELKRNLRKAVEEAEHSHWLASALIAGRVIQYLIAKIPGKEIEEKAENAIRLMVEKGYIPNDEKAIKSELEQLLRVEKLSRNLTSHNIHYWPRIDDSMILLGGAFKLARLLGSKCS